MYVHDRFSIDALFIVSRLIKDMLFVNLFAVGGYGIRSIFEIAVFHFVKAEAERISQFRNFISFMFSESAGLLFRALIP